MFCGEVTAVCPEDHVQGTSMLHVADSPLQWRLTSCYKIYPAFCPHSTLGASREVADEKWRSAVLQRSGTRSIQAGYAPGPVWRLCVAQLVTFSLRVVLEGSRILDFHEFSFLIRNRTAVTVQTARCFFYGFPKHGDFVAYKSYKYRHVPDRCRARGNNDSDASEQGCLKRHSFLVTQVWNMQKL